MIFDKLEQFFNGKFIFGPDSLTIESWKEEAKLVFVPLEKPEENVTDVANNLNTVNHELSVLEV